MVVKGSCSAHHTNAHLGNIFWEKGMYVSDDFKARQLYQ